MSYVMRFAELGRGDIAVAGGKGANLGELTRAGLPVPPGFVLTTAAYRAFGKDEWTARLWPALTGLLGIAFVFGIARKLYGREAAIAAAAIPD